MSFALDLVNKLVRERVCASVFVLDFSLSTVGRTSGIPSIVSSLLNAVLLISALLQHASSETANCF